MCATTTTIRRRRPRADRVFGRALAVVCGAPSTSLACLSDVPGKVRRARRGDAGASSRPVSISLLRSTGKQNVLINARQPRPRENVEIRPNPRPCYCQDFFCVQITVVRLGFSLCFLFFKNNAKPVLHATEYFIRPCGLSTLFPHSYLALNRALLPSFNRTPT